MFAAWGLSRIFQHLIDIFDRVHTKSAGLYLCTGTRRSKIHIKLVPWFRLHTSLVLLEMFDSMI